MASARRPRTFSRPAPTKGAEGGGVITDREDDGGGDRYKQRVSIFQLFTLRAYLLPKCCLCSPNKKCRVSQHHQAIRLFYLLQQHALLWFPPKECANIRNAETEFHFTH